MHVEDFKSCEKAHVYIPRKLTDGKYLRDISPEHFDRIMRQIIDNRKTLKYDCIVIDEADLFIPKDMRTLQRYPNILDLMDNHRHYGLAIVYISRRPQDINTGFVETSENLFLFAIEGKNVNSYMKDVHQDYETLMPQLKKENHNFIYKHLGESPRIFSKVSLKKLKGGQINNGSKKKNRMTNDLESRGL
jgi:hypothetical protein